MVLQVRLACSDGDCAVLYEAVAEAAALDALACDCGAGLQTLGWPEPAGDDRSAGHLAPVHW